MKITQAQGNGQGQCALCKKRGKWNVQWMCFLYKVEGKEGVYCKNCADELAVGDIVQTSAKIDREIEEAYRIAGERM